MSSPPATAGELIALSRKVTDFLDGEPGGPPPDWYRVGGDNSAVLGALHAELARTYPEAGPPLWAVRLFTNLLWQPAYLAVIGVHFGGVLPDLHAVSQRCAGIHADGYRLGADPVAGLGEDEMIARAGAQLKAMAGELLAEVNALEKLKRLPARRLLADRMLGLMTFVQRKRPQLDPKVISGWCARWLEAMDLAGQGDLEAVRLKDGREALIIKRKGCCLDYLIPPGVYCASCPKQPDALRIAHQRAETEALMAG
ncbi:hypothetical protein VE25_19975 [Devosia geojensis]|uniref:Ferric siderophore reductase C-terminal domain-containing protein n=1 Tax=Devosia geojensis TaxID=443610 RepID=A0A0F5FDD9_9HYPH|nr:siderophore ferric iron reductase [Devosia geojensis]KKB06939.1 hypothetical protein VE25_19975 [Devosia geojensis]